MSRRRSKLKVKKLLDRVFSLCEGGESARAAGLRYVSDQQAGISRVRAGRGFAYRLADGTAVRDRETLARIRWLAIPPAWSNVWICTLGHGHLQATGRDARGRKQYRYHPRWREFRDETKFARLVSFAHALPGIRARVSRDLAARDLSRNKVLAAVVQLLERTMVRVGNEEYARVNQSFGLTTMRDRHVQVDGTRVRFQFRGKSGRQHTIALTDRRLARVVKQCRDLPGYELFQYIDEQGERQPIDSADVNGYLRDISGSDFTAKDFRTWGGTVAAAVCLSQCERCTSITHGKRVIARAVEQVSQRLGNTPAICRKCYVHPHIFECYLQGCLPELCAEDLSSKGCELSRAEAAVAALLEQQLLEAVA